MKKIAICVVLVSTVSVACSEVGPRPPNADEVPGSVSVAGGTFTSGFAVGKIHKTVEVDRFSITKSPITVARYKQCVAVGACTPPALAGSACSRKATLAAFGATYELGDELPVTCATPGQARAYCAWQGGALPKESQWLLAARGTTPRRYAWGDGAPTCEQHPGGDDRKAICATDVSALRVGRHSKGVSPFAMEDVLLTPGELLNASDDATFCQGNGVCEAESLNPGEITAVTPVETNAKELPPWSKVYGFRCAWEGGAR